MNQTEQFELTINGTPPDLAEAICEGFVCESSQVNGESPAPANVTYLKFNGTWFRLYFEFRCVFWRRIEEHSLPWAAKEPWTEYVNLADKFKIAGLRLVSCVASATAKGSEIAFVFEGGLTVLFQDSDDRTSFEITGLLPIGSQRPLAAPRHSDVGADTKLSMLPTLRDPGSPRGSLTAPGSTNYQLGHRLSTTRLILSSAPPRNTYEGSTEGLMVRTRKMLAMLWATLMICLSPAALAGPTDDSVVATPLAKGVINVVQLDRYAGTLGNHRVQVFLGNTDHEIIGYYRYGNVTKVEADALTLAGGKNKSGKWELLESTNPANQTTQPQPVGRWVLTPNARGWQGSWTKPDGSSALAVLLHRELEAADYAELSTVNVTASGPDTPQCTIRIYRHQKMADAIDSDMVCEDAIVKFPDLNFDGHADMMINIDKPMHNTSYGLMLYDEARQRFIEAGTLTEPFVDPLHKNIVTSIHYSCCAHSAAIYRIVKGQAKLIQKKLPCSERDPKEKQKGGSCSENYEYDLKTGKIIEYDETQ